MSTKDNMSVETLLRAVYNGAYPDKGYDDIAPMTIDEALAALNKLRREDMEFVIGEDENSVERNKYGEVIRYDEKAHFQNGLRVKQRARMNQRLSGGKES